LYFAAREHRTIVKDDIEAIISRVEERMQKLTSKDEGLNLEDLSNFKSDSSVQQWEGEDFRTGVRGASFYSGMKCGLDQQCKRPRPSVPVEA
jgi:hypothetical protein